MAHTFFFSFKKLVLFSSQAYVPQILPVSGVAGWLLLSSHWQKEAVWMGEIVSFMAYVVVGVGGGDDKGVRRVGTASGTRKPEPRAAH